MVWNLAHVLGGCLLFLGLVLNPWANINPLASGEAVVALLLLKECTQKHRWIIIKNLLLTILGIILGLLVLKVFIQICLISFAMNAI